MTPIFYFIFVIRTVRSNIYVILKKFYREIKSCIKPLKAYLCIMIHLPIVIYRCSQIISYLQVLASKCKYGQSATTNRGDPRVVSTESVPNQCGLRTNEL